jgi:hypothetical protein
LRLPAQAAHGLEQPARTPKPKAHVVLAEPKAKKSMGLFMMGKKKTVATINRI